MQDVRAVWKDCARVLHSGGILMTGSMNSVHYIFDLQEFDKGNLKVAHAIPYSDQKDLSKRCQLPLSIPNSPFGPLSWRILMQL
jgi:hypothetical protein